MDDAAKYLALKRVAADAADIEAQLSLARGCRPLVTVLVRARQEAADALALLASVDPNDANAVRDLQNEVSRFRDLIRWLTDIARDGIEADKQIDDGDRDDIIRLIAGEETEDPDNTGDEDAD